MAEASWIYEGTPGNFPGLVLENSAKGLVLVYFWAELAGPCHRFFPVLAGVTRDFGGRFLLVTLNTDLHGPLARDLGVTSVPTLKLFRRGEAVETVHGYTSEAELRRVVERHLTRASDGELAEGVRLYRGGRVEEGLAALARAALSDPDNLRIPVTLAKLLMAQGRHDQAFGLLSGLPEPARLGPEVEVLMAHLGFLRVARDAPPRAELEAGVADPSARPDLRYRLAAVCLVEDDYEAALDQLMELVTRHRQWGDDAGRRGLLAVFGILGNEGPLVDRYRRRLFAALH